jgi:TonB family protein
VAEVFQFAPARRRNERVAASISLGITFDSRINAPLPAGGGSDPALRQPSTDPSANASTDPSPGTTASAAPPVATPYDMAPQVRNASQVRQALEREYPIGLRAARIGGRVEVWFYIDQQGTVEQFRVKESSGNTALDEAALRVARVFRFEPASRDGEPVAVWVPLAISFVAR